MHQRLAKLGLVKPRERINATLGKLLSAFFDTLAVKPGTATTYMPAATAAATPVGESSSATLSVGSAPRRAQLSR